MGSLNLADQIKQSIDGRIECSEQLLGKGILMPFNASNSGVRKLMYGTHLEQRLPLMKSEVPFVQTGYENQFGEYSSSFCKSDIGMQIIAKIPKFSSNPNHHFYLIAMSDDDKLRLIERVSYKHISETYGYIYNNEELDYLKVDDYIPSGNVIKKSTSFNEDNNRMDGINLITTYIASERTMEDGIVISDKAAAKLSSPLVKNVTVVINDNDIPLNLYGDSDTVYKSFPDIGELCENGIFCALRREINEESLYMQSYNKLREPMMSDDKFTVTGRVVDIDIHVNNPEKLISSNQYSQINEYYQDNLRFCRDIVSTVDQYRTESGALEFEMDYELQKLYFNCKSILDGKQYISERIFSNVIMNIIIIEENKFCQGDKLCNRYGCKGVVSKILPEALMPRRPNGEYVELILNMNTVINREDPGQLFELSLNFIAKRIIEYIQLEVMDISAAADLYIRFCKAVSQKFGDYIENIISGMKDDDLIVFLGSLADENGIYMSIDPMTENMDLRKLASVYKEFEWIHPEYSQVPIMDSNNEVRYVNSRRPLICAPQYFYRLKQYAKEKFSVTSLSSTNIRNENSRNKANNSYKALYAKTPIKFGDMEIGDMIHLGAEVVIENLMIYSTSPHARRLTEVMLTGDPFNINVRLDERSKNRNVEILNAYLKTMGLKLTFKRFEKKLISPILIEPIEEYGPESYLIEPIFQMHPDEAYNEKWILDRIEKEKNRSINPIMINPIICYDVDKPVF